MIVVLIDRLRPMDIAAFQASKDQIRERFNRFTRKAFKMLPKMDRPLILDAGCGSGVPTLELAEISNGQIIALDINQDLIDRLAIKIERAGLSDRVKATCCSMFEMNFPQESFDIIWAEGSIHVMGFEAGLSWWRQHLKPKGFLVVHDERENINAKLGLIHGCGYDLVGYFELDEQTWRDEYYSRLQKLIDEYRRSCAGDSQAVAALDKEQQEIEVFRKDPARCRSVFFIMSRR
jgi:ubiquinone/menaquinone biosynthesis C-methylase UbiE